MSRNAAVLGLGARGVRWARALHEAGWQVQGFDPSVTVPSHSFLRRQQTISATVRKADWIVVTVPDRPELIQSVVRRAQSEARDIARIAVVSPTIDVEAACACVLRPSQVMLVRDEGGTVALDVSAQTPRETKVSAVAFLSEVEALLAPDVQLQPDNAATWFGQSRAET